MHTVLEMLLPLKISISFKTSKKSLIATFNHSKCDKYANHQNVGSAPHYLPLSRYPLAEFFFPKFPRQKQISTQYQPESQNTPTSTPPKNPQKQQNVYTKKIILSSPHF